MDNQELEFEQIVHIVSDIMYIDYLEKMEIMTVDNYNVYINEYILSGNINTSWTGANTSVYQKRDWSDYVNSQLNFGGKLYYTSNKFMIQDKHRTWIVWYNRTLSDELKLGRLEQEVFDGTFVLRFVFG